MIRIETKLICPSGSFMHTVPLSFQGKTKHATVVFASNDNLKKKTSLKEAGELTYFGKSLKEVFDGAGISTGHRCLQKRW